MFRIRESFVLNTSNFEGSFCFSQAKSNTLSKRIQQISLPSQEGAAPFTCMSSEMNIEVIIGAKILSTVAAFSGGSKGFHFCSFQTVFIFLFGRKYRHIMKSKFKLAVLFKTVTVFFNAKHRIMNCWQILHPASNFCCFAAL